jgi:hypothetical protein
LKLLGEQWSGFDNISDHLYELAEILAGSGPVREMMTGAEWRKYESLPDTVTIYRGCSPNNHSGLSWSLVREVAETFPFLNRYRADQPLIVTARAQKSDIVALKDDRDELEIITIDPEIISVEPIPEERGRQLLAAHNAAVCHSSRSAACVYFQCDLLASPIEPTPRTRTGTSGEGTT